MNKEFFQQLFCKTTGQVYKFLGTVPADSTPVEHITKQFVSAANNTQLATVVVTVPRQNLTVIYVDDMTLVDSELFVLITDLIPEVIIPEVIETVIEDSTLPSEG